MYEDQFLFYTNKYHRDQPTYLAPNWCNVMHERIDCLFFENSFRLRTDFISIENIIGIYYIKEASGIFLKIIHTQLSERFECNKQNSLLI